MNNISAEKDYPFSNTEVLKVLQARKEHSTISKEFKEYLEMITTAQTASSTAVYPIHLLRKLNDIVSDIDPKLLCMLSNTGDINIIDSDHDKRKIEAILKLE